MCADKTDKKDKGNKEDKLKKIKAIQAAVSKRFGAEAMQLLDEDAQKHIPVISTGSIILDKALGVGGVPQGRIIEIYGPEASGKTTLTLHLAAECQKAGGVVAFVDAEHALDPKYATAIGVNMDELLLSQPDDGEQALDIVDMLAETGEVDLVIVDSVPALTPRAELNGEMGDQQMGAQARMMGKGIRKLTGKLKKSNCTVIFINQLRMKIGVMFGSPETTPGGRALPYAASMRLDVRRLQAKATESRGEIGIMKVKVVKNKVAVPFKTAEVPIRFGVGIDQVAEIYEVAKSDIIGIFDVRGAHHYYKGKKITLSDGTVLENTEDGPSKFAAKKDEALALLNKDKKFFEQVKKQVLARIEELKQA